MDPLTYDFSRTEARSQLTCASPEVKGASKPLSCQAPRKVRAGPAHLFWDRKDRVAKPKWVQPYRVTPTQVLTSKLDAGPGDGRAGLVLPHGPSISPDPATAQPSVAHVGTQCLVPERVEAGLGPGMGCRLPGPCLRGGSAVLSGPGVNSCPLDVLNNLRHKMNSIKNKCY